VLTELLRILERPNFTGRIVVVLFRTGTVAGRIAVVLFRNETMAVRIMVVLCEAEAVAGRIVVVVSWMTDFLIVR
jgi:hypothetical protein